MWRYLLLLERKLREHLFKWAGPIAANEVNIYKLRARKDIQVTSIEGLKQYRVGGARKDQKSQFLLSQGIDLLRVNNDHQNIDKLFAGRIDVMLYSADRLDYDVRNKNLDLNEIELLRNIPEVSTDIYVAFSQHVDDSIVAKFQAGFDAIKLNGMHDKIHMRWKTRH